MFEEWDSIYLSRVSQIACSSPMPYWSCCTWGRDAIFVTWWIDTRSIPIQQYVWAATERPTIACNIGDNQIGYLSSSWLFSSSSNRFIRRNTSFAKTIATSMSCEHSWMSCTLTTQQQTWTSEIGCSKTSDTYRNSVSAPNVCSYFCSIWWQCSK